MASSLTGVALVRMAMPLAAAVPLRKSRLEIPCELDRLLLGLVVGSANIIRREVSGDAE